MANVYVRSGAGGAGTGADWANAYTTLAAALTAKAAGDDFWVSDDHAETQASNMTLTSPGTNASPCRVVCVNHSGTAPPVSADLRTTATVTTTGNTNIAFGAGTAAVYGVTFTAGNSSGTALITFTNTSAWWWRLESCKLAIGTTGTGQLIVGAAGFNASLLELNNTTLSFGAVGHQFFVRAPVRWTGTSSALLGTIPTTLFTASSTAPGYLDVVGVDLSAAGSGKNLVDVSATVATPFQFADCKLGASVSLTTSSVAGRGCVTTRFVNCDSSNTNYRYQRQTYQGTITQETTVVRTGGATDGTTAVSRKMVSTANARFYSPLESDWIIYWANTTGSTTITIPVVTDNVTLTDAECWVEAEYLGTSSFPLGVFTSDRAADVLAAGANQTTDGTSTWTTTGLGTPVKQSLSVTFTTTGKGLIRARVCLAKASTTAYFDPLILASSGRQFMLGDSGHMNEAPSSSSSGGGKILGSSIVQGLGAV